MRISVNGVRLFFEVIGPRLRIDGSRMREKPTLLLLHGGPGVNDHSAFRPAFEQLADIAQVILIDHRGNGRSDSGPRDGWTLAQWGDDIRAFCDALEITRPIVMGNSFGGMVALSYACRHPDHPGRVIASSTMGRGADHYFDASVAMFTRLGGAEVGALARTFLREGLTPELAAAWAEKAFPVYTQSRSQLTNPDAQKRTVVSQDVAIHFLSNEFRSFDLLGALGKLQCPVLLLAGELDPICPVEAADDIASAVPAEHLTYLRYPNCGHGAYRDVPEAFVEIRRFVAAAEPPRVGR
jgi:pimeloyl-ACP methyl ester carboxylesterase